jgi:hypothetical protein
VQIIRDPFSLVADNQAVLSPLLVRFELRAANTVEPPRIQPVEAPGASGAEAEENRQTDDREKNK